MQCSLAVGVRPYVTAYQDGNEVMCGLIHAPTLSGSLTVNCVLVAAWDGEQAWRPAAPCAVSLALHPGGWGYVYVCVYDDNGLKARSRQNRASAGLYWRLRDAHASSSNMGYATAPKSHSTQPFLKINRPNRPIDQTVRQPMAWTVGQLGQLGNS